MHEIDKMRVTLSEKQALKNKYNEYYLHKAIDFLKYYFTLLDNKKFDDDNLITMAKEIKNILYRSSDPNKID